MRKAILSYVLCFVLVLSAVSFSFATPKVVESPNINIVIDGKLGNYADVPIIVDGRTLLPLRAILNNLGIKDENISWNSKVASVTVYDNDKQVYLKINDKNAYVDNAPVTIDVAPMIYKDRTYIPARFIAQSLGKAVIWDAATTTVLIRDGKEFDAVKEILTKADSAMKSASKVKFTMNTAIDIPQTGYLYTSNATLNGEYDNTKKIIHLSNATTDTYLANNALYTKSSPNSKWDKQVLSADEFNMLFNDSTSVISNNDVLYAGLTVGKSDAKDEILLTGNVYQSEILAKIAGNGEIVNPTDVYLEMSVDKETNLVNRVKIKCNATLKIDNENKKAGIEATWLYTDFAGNFDITLPKDLN